MSRPTISDFFRDLENYVLINNHIYRRDYDNPSKLNMTPVNKDVFKKKFDFTDRDYSLLPELDGFVCDPNHIDYQQIIGSKWNSYGQVHLNPRPGEWPTIKKLITHLYGANKAEPLDQTEELYDYHTLMLKNPKVKERGRILFSHIHGTSKSSLAELERLLFGDNVSKITDSEFESTFNSIWVSALVLWLDEPRFDNKKKMSRTIRDLVTSSVMNLRRMQTDYQRVDFHGKILITTNDSDFMPIEKGDRRYWVREIPMFDSADEDTNFMEKVKAEIDHYIYFLLNREMKYPTKSDKTFWLPASVIDTNGFKKLVGDNTSDLEKTITELIETFFIDNKSVEEVMFRLMDIKEKAAAKMQVRTNTIKDLDVVRILRDSMHLEQPEKNSRPRKDHFTLSIESSKEVGRWWIANRENFNTEVDLFNIPEECY